MKEIIKINFDNQTVSARELFEKLNLESNFTTWFHRMCDYGFYEGVDFFPKKEESRGGRPSTDFDISVDMAKEICMIQRTAEGKIIRQYFLDLEKAWNTPEQIMARALKVADQTINALHTRITIMEPKASYYDQLVDKGTCSNIRDTSKEFGIGQKQLVNWLIDNRYIYRANNGLRPYMEYTESGKGYFTLKDTHNVNNSWSGQQMYITVKGKETFRKLLQEELILV